MTPNDWVRIGTSLAFGLGGSAVLLALVSFGSLPVALGGVRGSMLAKRSRAVPGYGSLAQAARWVGRWLELLVGALARGPRLRAALERHLAGRRRALGEAGESLGLCEWGLWGLCSVLAVFGFFGALLLGRFWAVPPSILAVFGFAWPLLHLSSERARRIKAASRELPPILDLIVLSMTGGADFASAVGRVVTTQAGTMADELAVLLHSLRMGMTKRAALLELRARLPASEVVELVQALLLAEEKGAPAAEVLRQTAVSSRLRRSVRAEEAAARAGTLLVFPLTLLMGCVMILLLGPLLVGGVGF